MKKLNSLMIMFSLVACLTIEASSQTRCFGDMKARGMGGTMAGVSNDAGLLWSNVAGSAFLTKPSVIFFRATATGNKDGRETITNFGDDISDYMTFKFDALERTGALYRLGDYADEGPVSLNMAVAPLGIVGRPGGWSTIGQSQTVISRNEIGEDSEIIMDRDFDLRTMFAFTRSRRLLGGTAAWGFGIPLRCSMRIHEEGTFNKSDSGYVDLSDNYNYYSTYTDLGYNIGLDVGFMYEFLSIFRVGFAAHDLFSSPIKWKRHHIDDIGDISTIKIGDEEDDDYEELETERIETSYTASLACNWDLDFLGFFREFQVGGELHSRNGEEITYNAGAETRFLRVFRLRCGIDEYKNLCYGAGFALLRILECNFASYWEPKPTISTDEGSSIEWQNVYGVSVGLKF